MIAFSEWFPLAVVGLAFTALGAMKLWGLKRGIVSSAGMSPLKRICGP